MKSSAFWLTTAAAAAMIALAPASAQYSGAPAGGAPSAMPPQTPDYDMPNRTMQPQAGTMAPQGSMQTTGVSVNALDNAPQKLANATVEDSSGATVGKVARVQTSSSGKVRKVEVSLTSGNKTVAIPATYLHFNTDKNTLNANLSRSQIDNLPST